MRPFLLLLLVASAQAQPSGLSGFVLDAEDSTPLIGATAVLPELDRGVVTDGEGHFSISDLPAATYVLEVRYVGYRTERVRVPVPQEAPLVVRLTQDLLLTREVLVTASPTGGAATQATQAFRLEELQRRAAPSFGEMLDGAAGVAMRSYGSAPARPVIRGLDGDRVLVVENGERMGDLAETAADHAVALDPLAVHRIEVVRGPASLLYGPSAVGGVINLFNEDLPRTWEPGLSGQGTLLGATVNALGAGHGRLLYGADAWALGSRFAVRGAGDTATPEGPLPGTFLQSTSGAVGASWRPNGPDGALAGGSLAGQTYTYGLPEPDDDDGVEIRMHRLTASGLVRLPGRGRLDGVEVRFSASDYGHSEATSGGGDISLAFDQRSASVTTTLRHAGRGPLAAGALGFNASARDVLVGGEEALTPDASALGLAVFMFEEVALTGALRLQGGLRLDGQTLHATANAQYPGFSARRTTATLSGALGLHLRPAEGAEGGVQIARAYRLPRLEELYADAPHLGAGVYEVGTPTLGNEVALGLDAFARTAFGPVALEAAAFANRIDGFVVFQPSGAADPGSGLPIHVYEAAAALLWGGELAATVRLARSVSAEAGVDYVHGSRRDASATPLPAIPPLRSRVAFSWDDGALRLGTSARLVAAQRRVAPNEQPTDGYALLGLEAAYRLQRGARHVIAFRADNLLDVAYRDHLSRVEQREAAMPGRNLVLSYQILF